jgi:hypothetical protein
MKTIEFDKIFHIADDGIYYVDGEIKFSTIKEIGGFHGEAKLDDGAFVVIFYDCEQTTVVFPFSKFGQGQNAVKDARAECGSFILFLENEGLRVKPLENS